MISNEKSGLWNEAGKDLPTGGPVPIEPLTCDRWLASSALQKAIRRGEVILAQRAARTLCDADRRSLWPHCGASRRSRPAKRPPQSYRSTPGGEEAAVLLACRLLAE